MVSTFQACTRQCNLQKRDVHVSETKMVPRLILLLSYPNSGWSTWTNSNCSSFCGQSHMIRSRKCLSLLDPGLPQVDFINCPDSASETTTTCITSASDLYYDHVVLCRGQFGNPIDYFNKDWASYVNGFGELGQYRAKKR